MLLFVVKTSGDNKLPPDFVGTNCVGLLVCVTWHLLIK